MKHLPGSLAFAVAALLFASPALAQLPNVPHLYRDEHHFGSAVANIGDVDGDGVADLAVGATGSHTKPGRVYVYSAAKGTLLYAIDGHSADDCFGVSMASLGDIDHDGTPDFVVGAFGWEVFHAGTTQSKNPEPNGSARIYSGKNGALLRELASPADAMQFGWRVASAGDVDGDGTADAAVGAPAFGTTMPSRVVVYSGSTGRVLYSVKGTIGANDGVGFSLASVGDLNGDGRPDFVAGDPNTRLGSVSVFSGADGKLIRTLTGRSVSDSFGNSITGGLDVNGDGVPDFAVGSRAGNGMVQVFSGRDGAELGKVEGTPDYHIGESILLSKDLDGDGHPDLLVASDSETTLRHYSLTGAPWHPADLALPPSYAGNFPPAMCVMDPQVRSGLPTIAVGKNWAKAAVDQPSTGCVWILDAGSGRVIHKFSPPIEIEQPKR